LVKAGCLVHVYNLGAAGWESFVWGSPERGLMGVLPKLVQLLLVEDPDEPIDKIILYTGPSKKDGLDESEYTKRFLLDHCDKLESFRELDSLLRNLDDTGRATLRKRLEGIVNGHQIANTAAEVINAAAFFREHGITKVYQLAIASHAPRCIKAQAVARYTHQIPAEQFWYTIAAETSFKGTTPDDVVIAEPPHRLDDPELGVHPGMTDVLKRYYELSYEQRTPFLKGIENILDSFPGKE